MYIKCRLAVYDVFLCCWYLLRPLPVKFYLYNNFRLQQEDLFFNSPSRSFPYLLPVCFYYFTDTVSQHSKFFHFYIPIIFFVNLIKLDLLYWRVNAEYFQMKFQTTSLAVSVIYYQQLYFKVCLEYNVVHRNI